MKKHKYSYMKSVKDTMRVGVGSMAGMGVMGAMTKIPGMPSQASGVAKTAGVGLGLANVGQLASTGMGIVGDIGKNKRRCKIVKNIIG